MDGYTYGPFSCSIDNLDSIFVISSGGYATIAVNLFGSFSWVFQSTRIIPLSICEFDFVFMLVGVAISGIALNDES